MASRLAYRALRVQRATPLRLQPAAIRNFSTTKAVASENQASKDALKSGAKRDPELYILLSIMAAAFGGAGWYFSRSPTTSTSETAVSKVIGSEPWKTGGDARYQYHPGGDTSAAPKDAPSALNVVVIPDVDLPKELHDQFNKWGKDGYP